MIPDDAFALFGKIYHVPDCPKGYVAERYGNVKIGDQVYSPSEGWCVVDIEVGYPVKDMVAVCRLKRKQNV